MLEYLVIRTAYTLIVAAITTLRFDLCVERIRMLDAQKGKVRSEGVLNMLTVYGILMLTLLPELILLIAAINRRSKK